MLPDCFVTYVAGLYLCAAATGLTSQPGTWLTLWLGVELQVLLVEAPEQDVVEVNGRALRGESRDGLQSGSAATVRKEPLGSKTEAELRIVVRTACPRQRSRRS